MSSNLWLNLGSGQRKFKEPWVNIDSQSKWNPDVVRDIHCYLTFLDDNSVDMICLHHVLEHFGCGEASPLLTQCYRVLKSGGSLLVFVPDMHELVDMWKEGKITDQVFMTNVYGAYMGDDADRHKWGFTWNSLTSFLETTGFSNCVPYTSKLLKGADIAQGRWILGVEAYK